MEGGGGGWGAGGMCCTNLYIKVSEQVSATYIYIYICQRGICFLLSKVNNPIALN